MTVPSGGDIGILNDNLQGGHSSIGYYVDGNTNGPKNLRQLGTKADINNTGTHMSEFRNDPTYGSFYGEEINEAGWARKTSGGPSYDLQGSESRLLRNQSGLSATWAIYSNGSGGGFTVFDEVIVTVYRREKGTFGSWQQMQNWIDYVTSTDNYYCDFNNYDWKWKITV